MRIYTANWRFTLAAVLEVCAVAYGLAAVTCALAASISRAVYPPMLWALAGLFALGAVLILRCARDIRR